MIATGETVGLAGWIIDDTCLIYFILEVVKMFGSVLALLAQMMIQSRAWARVTD